MDINKIYHENCNETMLRMPDGFVDLVVTSPPYDNLRKYNGYSFDFEEVAKNLVRVLKPGGVIVWVVGDGTKDGSESGTSFRQALYFMSLGLNLHDTMIYAKKNFIPLTHNRYEQAFEYMFVFSKGKPKTFNPIMIKCIREGESKNYSAAGSNVKEGGYRRRNAIIKTNPDKIHSNIFYYPTGSNMTKHPAPFPEDLARDHVLSWSNEGDLVYDPFGGSGTTAKMSHILKRNWILSEISDEYVDMANKRLQPLLSQKELF